ncbi:unnamed protein product [Symbiodinium natans]|uniref:Uncharacterized protein n=1 Tax=Symbiodinium natans TaxID=878477 RepID=A0A812R819_9DINO|nr:unnamed protein product [Symbiodinium natans]
MVTTSPRLPLDGSECLDAARSQGLRQPPAPPLLVKEAGDISCCLSRDRSVDLGMDSRTPANADEAVEAARQASERARRTRLRASRPRTKTVSAAEPLARSRAQRQAREQHADSLPTPQSSLTPLSSSILDDMRTSFKDPDCASDGTTPSTSHVGSLQNRPVALPPPPPDHDAGSSPADDAWSWKSIPAGGSACITPAGTGTMMDSQTPIHTEVSEASMRWQPPICNILPPLPPVSCELRFWIEAMEAAQKGDLLQDAARFFDPRMPTKPRRSAHNASKDPKAEVDAEVSSLRQQMQAICQDRDAARSELAQLQADHRRLQESAEELRQKQQELEVQRKDPGFVLCPFCACGYVPRGGTVKTQCFDF